MRPAPPCIRRLLARRTIPKLLRLDRPLHLIGSRNIVARVALALSFVGIRCLGIRSGLGWGDRVGGGVFDVEHWVVVS